MCGEEEFAILVYGEGLASPGGGEGEAACPGVQGGGGS
jgi:hypothetical protein